MNPVIQLSISSAQLVVKKLLNRLKVSYLVYLYKFFLSRALPNAP